MSVIVYAPRFFAHVCHSAMINFSALATVSTIDGIKRSLTKGNGNAAPPAVLVTATLLGRLSRLLSCYALRFCLFVSPPSLPTNSFTNMGRYALLFYWIVSSPGLPTYSFTSLDRRYVVLLFYWLISSPSLSAYPFTRLDRLHSVCSRVT
jgi:hypothetical protein